MYLYQRYKPVTCFGYLTGYSQAVHMIVKKDKILQLVRVNNQLDAFFDVFISLLYMFRAN